MAENNDWDYVDQSRNWGWTCAWGFKQSPINIEKEWQMDPNFISHDALMRFNYKSFQKQPPVKITIDNKQFLMEGAAPTDNWGELVIHPGSHPSTAFS